MKFAVVVFACVLAAANAQFGNQGQYFPQRENYQYNKYNQYNRYNPYNNNYNNNYNRYQNYNPYKPYVTSTPYPRPAVTFAEAKATVSPSVAPVDKPVFPAVTPVVPVVTAAPVVPVSVPRVVADARSAETVKYGNEINPDGTYSYFYETNNGIAAQAQGSPRSFGGNPPAVADVAQGSFSWTSPEGEVIAITYVADENGYQPTGNAIPQPPPIPPQIARALEYIARTAPVAAVSKN